MKTDDQLDTSFYITGWILLGVLGVLMMAAGFLRRDLLHSLPPCLIHAVTGLYCPGCGATRAVHALGQGRMLWAWFYHPFIPYVAVVGGWFMLSQTVERVSRHRFAVGMHFRYLYAWIGLGLIFGNLLVKNAILVVTGISVMG